MKKKSKLKRHEYQEIYEKYFDKGWSQRKIARKLDVSPTTVKAWISEMEEEIAALKAQELEALQGVTV